MYYFYNMTLYSHEHENIQGATLKKMKIIKPSINTICLQIFSRILYEDFIH